MTDEDPHPDGGQQASKGGTQQRSKRFELLNDRPVNQDGLVEEWPDVGFVAMGSPDDPDPSITVTNGTIVEMDGTDRDDFDFVDRFIADYAINPDVAEEAVGIDSVEFARMLADINVPREEIRRLAAGMTPAKLTEVVNQMNTVEMMMALQKVRTRKNPGNQCHVTSVKDHPAQLVADAAEAALRGFDEAETTVGITRIAPFNALSLLIGTQCGRGGTLTQCAVEEATELELGMRGITSYAETVSVYGTEDVFKDGDDTPWSKAFLASGYASRGVKMRFTSGSGSEVNMGQAEGKSMLYLETKCVLIAKGCGVQGLQNGSISTVAIPAAVPSGLRCILAENLIAGMIDLEMASGNDQTFTHSDTRRTAHMIPQMFSGTDFIFSGYSAVPNYDDMFAGSTFDSSDFDDYNLIQRDFKVDGGTKDVEEETVIKYRNRAVKALQAVFEELGFPPITDEEVEAATYADGSEDMPDRNQAQDIEAAQELMEREITGADVARILDERGFEDIAENILGILKSRVSGDYLQTSAILDEDFNVVSAVNNPNDYEGPGSGYRISDERWEEIKTYRHAINPEDV